MSILKKSSSLLIFFQNIFKNFFQIYFSKFIFSKDAKKILIQLIWSLFFILSEKVHGFEKQEVIEDLTGDEQGKSVQGRPKFLSSKSPNNENEKKEDIKTNIHEPILAKKTKTHSESGPSFTGNLPNYSLRRSLLDSVVSPLTVVKSNSMTTFQGLSKGDILEATITQSIIAYEDSFSPIRAMISSGPLKGGLLLGNATMDAKTKNVLVKFDTFRPKHEKEVYTLVATLHDSSGSLGIEGEFESHYWRYFWAETLIRSVSGYSDALTTRSKNMFGAYEMEPSLDTAAKQGVASAANHAGEKLSERTRSLPEYTRVQGPIKVKIILLSAVQSQ